MIAATADIARTIPTVPPPAMSELEPNPTSTTSRSTCLPYRTSAVGSDTRTRPAKVTWRPTSGIPEASREAVLLTREARRRCAAVVSVTRSAFTSVVPHRGHREPVDGRGDGVDDEHGDESQNDGLVDSVRDPARAPAGVQPLERRDEGGDDREGHRLEHRHPQVGGPPVGTERLEERPGRLPLHVHLVDQARGHAHR